MLLNRPVDRKHLKQLNYAYAVLATHTVSAQIQLDKTLQTRDIRRQTIYIVIAKIQSPQFVQPE